MDILSVCVDLLALAKEAHSRFSLRSLVESKREGGFWRPEARRFLAQNVHVALSSMCGEMKEAGGVLVPWPMPGSTVYASARSPMHTSGGEVALPCRSGRAPRADDPVRDPSVFAEHLSRGRVILESHDDCALPRALVSAHGDGEVMLIAEQLQLFQGPRLTYNEVRLFGRRHRKHLAEQEGLGFSSKQRADGLAEGVGSRIVAT